MMLEAGLDISIRASRDSHAAFWGFLQKSRHDKLKNEQLKDTLKLQHNPEKKHETQNKPRYRHLESLGLSACPHTVWRHGGKGFRAT